MRVLRYAFHLTVIAVLTQALVTLIRNLNFLQRLEDEAPPDPNEEPVINVLIPARNEAESLPRCLESLQHQAYTRYSVTVLDDNSTDGTADVVRQFAERSDRFRLVQGAPLPEGWVGKPWACHQLAEQTDGEILLFVDADTHFTPDVLARVSGIMQREQPGLLSTFPHQETETIGERIVLPGLYMLFLCSMPIWYLEDPNHPDIAAANGQFICMSRKIYKQVGGHQVVHDRVVEDLPLSWIVKAAGFRVIARTASESVHCRMYRSNQEVIDGFAKNAFVTFGERASAAITSIIGMTAVFIVPAILLGRNLRRGSSVESWGPPAVATGLGFLLRWLTSRRTGFRQRDTIFAHVNVVAYVMIVLRSMWWHYVGGGYKWKGRQYPGGTSGD
jgi:chlorobactene glucosyltransferase